MPLPRRVLPADANGKAQDRRNGRYITRSPLEAPSDGTMCEAATRKSADPVTRKNEGQQHGGKRERRSEDQHRRLSSNKRPPKSPGVRLSLVLN